MKDVVKALEGRIEAIKQFDSTFTDTVSALVKQVETLSAGVNPNELSNDKSVRSHIRQRLGKVNKILARCKRDLNAIITALQNETPAGE